MSSDSGGADRVTAVGVDDDNLTDETVPHELNGGWSQYEYMGDADRGLLLEKAILALGISDSDDNLQDRAQYESDAAPATRRK